MNATATIDQLSALCRADESRLGRWLGDDIGRWSLVCVATVVLGCGVYGASIGVWRSPLQGIFAGIKFPVIILVTLLLNGLINGMLAQVLGTGLSFAQSLVASMMGFTTFALIVGSLSPVTFFMVVNAPPPDAPGAAAWHSTFLLTHTAVIAYAGVVGNYKAYRLLAAYSGKASAALRTFLAWLAINLFAGSQLAWNLRPFFGQPHHEVQFLRPNFNDGNFFENVLSHFQRLIS